MNYNYASELDADDMCPNCVTPWKCNGPHYIGESRNAYEEGFKAGMRRAAEIAMLPDTDGLTVQDAILAEADK